MSAVYDVADIFLQDGEAAVTQCLETFGKLDILVNCAAGNFLAPASELSPKGFKTVMDIDAVGTFNMCRASFSALARVPSPVIINISATLHHGGFHGSVRSVRSSFEGSRWLTGASLVSLCRCYVVTGPRISSKGCSG